MRSHSKSLTSSVTLEALNHEVAGLVPAVVLMSEIPNTAKEPFLSGRPFVTTKDKVFGPSDPFRRGAELTSILRSQYSADALILGKKNITNIY